jgi:hydrocephalus-inducing protein
MCPVCPNEFKEIVNVQVGYFEPEPITITGKGYYPAILLDVPRGENINF